MEPHWIRISHEVVCLACRRVIYPGYHIYSLTGTEYGYCLKCGRVAEQSIKQNEAHRERERKILAGEPV